MLVCLLLTVACGAPQEALTLERLLGELSDRRALCESPAPAYTCRQFSSYDRRSRDPQTDWFANGDAGQYLRMEERDGRSEGVLMDAAGPGALVRLWSANPKGVLRVYLDGADAPALERDMAELLGGRGPVPAPLAQETSSGWTLYLPLPYAQRCVITCDEPQGVYYHCNYRTYAAGTPVESFAAGDLEAHASAIAAAGRALTHTRIDPASEVRPFEIVLSPAAGRGTARSFELDFGARAQQPRALTEISLQVEPEGGARAEALEALLRSSVLSLVFDGVECVRAPLGDFFGSAPGLNPFVSFPLEVRASGELVCRFVMPFRERATLRVTLLGSQRARFQGRVASAPYAWSERTLYFHARWRSADEVPTRPLRDWNLITIAGRGNYVGDMLAVGNPVRAWWGEGDEKIYVDGESFPSHFGTGTEDYYGYAWCSPLLFQHPLHAQTRCDGPQNFGWTSVNRFRALDAIPFATSLRFDLEVWHSTADVAVDYAATTYFYADLAARDDTPPLEPALALGVEPFVYEVFRVPGALEGEQLAVLDLSPGLVHDAQPLAGTDEGQWSGGEQLFVRANAVGQFIELALPVETAVRREVRVYPTRSWDYGNLQFSLDGVRAGEPLVTFNAEAESKIGVPQPVALGVFELHPPSARLRIEVVGSHPRSRPPHYHFGLDCVVLAPPPQ